MVDILKCLWLGAGEPSINVHLVQDVIWEHRKSPKYLLTSCFSTVSRTLSRTDLLERKSSPVSGGPNTANSCMWRFGECGHKTHADKTRRFSWHICKKIKSWTVTRQILNCSIWMWWNSELVQCLIQIICQFLQWCKGSNLYRDEWDGP